MRRLQLRSELKPKEKREEEESAKKMKKGE